LHQRQETIYGTTAKFYRAIKRSAAFQGDGVYYEPPKKCYIYTCWTKTIASHATT